MSKTILREHKQKVYIRSTRKDDLSMYWQCGQWVNGVANATRYYDAQEADMVIAFRNLHDVEIVEA